MRAFLLAAILVSFVGVGLGEDVVSSIKQEAESCAKALVTGDYDAVVRYTSPRIVLMVGGKEAMINLLKNGRSQMQAQGFDFGEVTIGQPEDPKKIGEWMVSTVPQHLVMKAPGGKLYQDSSLLGISEDAGKHWVFMDLGSVTPDQLGKVYPELVGKISLPEKKPPVFKKD